MKTYLITGVCGFIGSNLALRLLNEGHRVIGVDRLHDRQRHILEHDLSVWHKQFTFYDWDLASGVTPVINDKIDMVFHLAANADVRFSSVYPDKDLNDGIYATYCLLRWMKEKNIKKIAYASTSAIYGDPKKIPTPENYSFTQTSFYGASKVAGECMIQAHCAAYDTKAWIFRFASITGPRYSHGFIYNFYRSLKQDPTSLYIHGGKEQRKTYLDVDDCIEAILTAVNKSRKQVNTFNLGNDETCTLLDSIPIITTYMGVNPELVWSGNEVGWIGDSKVNYLDVRKIKKLGWKPKYNIEQSIIRTLDWLDANQWILEAREEL
jgi:UDP-glucose 4-epimerase